jgi:putative aldouronate transport system permease protein
MNSDFKRFLRSSPSDKLFIILVYTALTVVLLLVLLPLMFIVSASLSEPQAVISGKVFLLPKDITLKGYTAIIKYGKFLTGFRNSIFYTTAGTFLSIIMTLLCAFPLSRKEFTARNKISAYFVFTMYFSGGMIPSYMLINGLDMIDSVWAIIIPSAMSTYNMIICKTYMVNSIPDELYEAGCIDGCTPFHYLRKVVIPLCRPIIAVLVLYYGVAKWNSYYDAMLYIKSESLNPLTIVLRQILILNQVDMTKVSDVTALEAQRGLTDLLKYSTIVVASLPVLVIYPFVQKHFVKGVMIGAVKG